MKRTIAITAFAVSVLGLLFIFEVLPGVGSFLGSVLLVIGGSVLVCSSIVWETGALPAKPR